MLVVEDEASVRDIVTEVLTRRGYRVLTAASGPEGMELWRRHRQEVDLLLTDIVMPGGMDGHALATAILQEAPALKVAYMSGYIRTRAGRQSEFKAGENYLPKPFEISHLVQFVRQALDS